MSDIKTEPNVSICCGCLSTDRTLSLISEDLYWPLIKDQQNTLLIAPYLCWECTAQVRRLQRFQKQVQKAYSNLRDCLVSSSNYELTDPKNASLSKLIVQHHRKFDAIFTQIMPDVMITHSELETQITKEYNDKYTVNEVLKNEPSSGVSDDDDLKTDDIDTSVSPEINSQNRFKNPEPKSSQMKIEIPKDIKTINERIKPKIKQISSVTKHVKTENLLTKLNKANVFVKKTRVPKTVSKNKTNTASLVKTPAIRAIEMELKKIINSQQNLKVDKHGRSQKSHTVKTSSKDEIEYSTDDDFQEENIQKPEKFSQKSKTYKATKEDTNSENEIEYSDGDDFIGMNSFDDDDDSDNIEDKHAKTNVSRIKSTKRKKFSEKSKTNEDINVKNDDNNADMEPESNKFEEEDDLPINKCTISVEPLSFPKTASLTKLELQLKKLIQEKNIWDSQNKKDENNEEKNNPKINKVRTEADSDPDFCPEEDDEPEKSEKVNDAPKKVPHKIKRRKYKRVKAHYSNIEEVSQYFTEVEMSKQEFISILEKEDAVVNEKRPHSCHVCGKHFERTKTLYAHGRWTHKLPYRIMVDKRLTKALEFPVDPCLWKCHICTRYIRKDHALEHAKENHRLHFLCNGEGCEWCPKIYWTKDEFMKHWESMHKNYVCDICDKRVLKRSTMIRHMNEEHFRVRTLQCPQCPKMYYQRQQFKRHLSYAHPKPEPVELRYCVECDVTFRSSKHYGLHVRNKHTEKTNKGWQCQECGRVLRSEVRLQAHVDFFHKGVLKFQCEKCGKYLAHRSGLRKHLLVHQNVKVPYKFPCPMCGRMFQIRRTLRQHIYTHTGERPYKCDMCPAAYTQKYCLKVHLAKVHGSQAAASEKPLSTLGNSGITE